MQNIPVVDLQAFREGGLAAIDQLALVEVPGIEPGSVQDLSVLLRA